MPSFMGTELRDLGKIEFPSPGSGVYRRVWTGTVRWGTVMAFEGALVWGARLKGPNVLLRGEGATLDLALRDLEAEAKKWGLGH